ncbi:MAG TPA: pilus assembly protein N-terminal domain-containing protein [Desulfopila sp.]|nr:pilus assembly protein N-terminal domain-containing protein [Desulfopila sp.]
MTDKTERNTRKILTGVVTLLLSIVFIAAMAVSGAARPRKTIDMYVGEVEVLKMEGIERVAIGNPAVASNTILPQGQLVILGDAEGVTTMHIWLKNGTEKDFDIKVEEKEALDSHQELVRLLANVQGVKAEKVGNLSVVKGNVSLADKSLFDRIVARYENVLNLVEVKDTIADITGLLADVPGITIKEVGGNLVVSGEISEEYAKLIDIVVGKYPDIINLTRVHEAVAGKMIYMQVRIMEVNKKVTEKLGINWTILKGIPGPSLEFGFEVNRNNSTVLNTSPIPQSLKKTGAADLTSAAGYFGIATGLGSILNFYEGTGDAVVLAQPRLSTRSGGSAEFLAGGEFPVPVTNSLGSTDVEFKKYGISLNVEPVVDDNENILAHIETEISTIDQGTAVNGIPGILTRRTQTDVSLRASETLVIAGLVQDLANKDYDKVKWLNEIPVLGELFKSRQFNNQKTELVIFITPTVYDASSPVNTANLKKGEEIQRRFENITQGERLLE